MDTEAALDKIRGDLNAIREKLDDKSQYVFGFAEGSYQACGTDTRGEAMDWLNRLMGSLKGFDAPEDYLNLYLCDKTVDETESKTTRGLWICALQSPLSPTTLRECITGGNILPATRPMFWLSG